MASPRVRRAAGGAVVAAALACLASGVSVARAADDFAVAGEVDGLYPGASMTLDAVVTNPYPFTISVVSVSVSAADAGPGCPASMLSISGSTDAVEIPARSVGTIPLAVRMSSSAPDACQGAVWPLQFSATAVAPGEGDLPDSGLLDPRRATPLIMALGVALTLLALMLRFGRQARRRRGSA
jgi:hypothetical protein